MQKPKSYRPWQPEQINLLTPSAEEFLEETMAVAVLALEQFELLGMDLFPAVGEHAGQGFCWGNAVVEKFLSTFKHELIINADANILNRLHQLIGYLAFWINGYNNRERRHSTIIYLSPNDCEQY